MVETASKLTNDLNGSTDLVPTLRRAYTEMLRARKCDEKAITLYKQNKCHFQIGVAGHEAVQVAAGHVFRPSVDWFYPYYRDMALCVALGMTSRELMLNAMNREADPNSHGRQMPMHYGHKDLRIVNQSSPTGTQFLQAVGCALGARRSGLDEVVYVSAGEGTCSQGDFHEALNWAARERLPVIFLIENNKYAISVHISEQLASSVAQLGQGYESLETVSLDGTDYLQCLREIKRLYERARAGQGPALIEAHVPRLQSHSISDNQRKYRTPEDLNEEQERDPIVLLERHFLESNLVSQEELQTIADEVKREIDEAAVWAEAQPEPDPSTATHHTFLNSEPWTGVAEHSASGAEAFMVDALNQGLAEELERDPDVFVFGQDVAHGKGGVFTVTNNLTARFGAERVFNAPLAESSIIGVSVGMAARGLKPVPEIQFGDYIWTGMMHLRNEVALIRYRSAGDFGCPTTIRVPIGGYIHGGTYHSQNIEATFAHFPGLFVVLPSNATDAKGLLKAAIRCEDPVLFLEHKGLYRQVYAKGPLGGPDDLTPIGRAKVVREGSDATVVTWGALVQKSLLAAKELEQHGYQVEVIDLRTIVPFDRESIFESVRKTSRVLIAHEDLEFMGFGAEVAAQIATDCFEYLDAPVKRVGMKYAAAVPHGPALEVAILPQTEQVQSVLNELLAY